MSLTARVAFCETGDMADVKGNRRKSRIGSIRARTLLAGIALLAVFAGMAILAIWRTGQDHSQHAVLENKSQAVAALEEARSQFYYSATLLMMTAISEDPNTVINSYENATAQAEASLKDAENAFAAQNDADALQSLRRLNEQLDELRPTLDGLIVVGLTSHADALQQLATQYLPQVWPSVSLILLDLAQLADAEQTKLNTATVDANSQANTSLWLMVTFGVVGFLIVLAVLWNLILSIVRPLGSLQRSVRAVQSGDMEARAEVSGPTEVASLAADFNSMISQTDAAAQQMQHRLLVESAVARTTTLLNSTEDIDAGLNGALKSLAEAIDADHAYLFMFNDERTKMRRTHRWNATGEPSLLDRPLEVDSTDFGRWVDRLRRNEEVIVHDVTQLPEDANAERTVLQSINAKCALAVPFGPAGRPDGFIGFGDTRRTHIWQDEDMKLLRLGSDGIAWFVNRLRSEGALRESEERFRSLSASAPIGIFLTDSRGESVYVNERLLATSGLTLDAALGRGWTRVVHDDDREGVILEKDRANRDNDEFALDFRIMTPQGNVRWVSVHSTPIGTNGARVGTLEDITERKQAEDELRQSEERFRTLGASAPIGIFHSDAKGRVMFVNDRFVEIAGVSLPDEVDRNWFDVIHPADRDGVIGGVVEAIKARTEFIAEFRLQTPDGATRWVSGRAKEMRDSKDRFIGLMGTIEDISERRARDEALRQSEERFRSLSGSAPVGILLTSAGDLVTYTNECLRSIVGLDTDEARDDVAGNFTLWAFVHPDDRPEVLKAHLEALSHDPYDFLREFRIVTPRGEVRWVRVHVTPIPGEGAKPERVGTVEDITEHKMLEEERQSAYERTTLLLAIAAEARDPYTEHHLFRIRGLSEAIARQMGLSPEMTREIGLASLLHDIGKTRVPDAILTKPGPLTEAEWQLIRRHTVWGEELLPENPWFVTARQIARCHHENWDGTGYPDNLKEDQIPLSATIVAVADGFDAMISKRPYKSAWPAARALREVRSNKGHRYSPEVVDAFARAVAEGTIARIVSIRRSKLADLMKAA